MNARQSTQVMLGGAQAILAVVNIATGVNWFILLSIAIIVFHIIMFIVFRSDKPAIESAPVEKKIDSKKELSWPAEQIIKAYNKLPDENKAYGDLRMTLEALDVQYVRGDVNDHFKIRNANYNDEFEDWCHWSNFDDYEPVEFFHSWEHKCNKCPMPEYTEFFNIINGIHAEIKKQKAVIAQRIKDEERALELAGIKAEVDNIPMVMAALRKEHGNIRSITADIVS